MENIGTALYQRPEPKLFFLIKEQYATRANSKIYLRSI